MVRPAIPPAIMPPVLRFNPPDSNASYHATAANPQAILETTNAILRRLDELMARFTDPQHLAASRSHPTLLPPPPSIPLAQPAAGLPEITVNPLPSSTIFAPRPTTTAAARVASSAPSPATSAGHPASATAGSSSKSPPPQLATSPAEDSSAGGELGPNPPPTLPLQAARPADTSALSFAGHALSREAASSLGSAPPSPPPPIPAARTTSRDLSATIPATTSAGHPSYHLLPAISSFIVTQLSASPIKQPPFTQLSPFPIKQPPLIKCLVSFSFVFLPMPHHIPHQFSSFSLEIHTRCQQIIITTSFILNVPTANSNCFLLHLINSPLSSLNPPTSCQHLSITYLVPHFSFIILPQTSFLSILLSSLSFLDLEDKIDFQDRDSVTYAYVLKMISLVRVMRRVRKPP